LGLISLSYSNFLRDSSILLVIFEPKLYNFFVSGFSSVSSLQKSQCKVTALSIRLTKFTNLPWNSTSWLNTIPAVSLFFISESNILFSIICLYLKTANSSYILGLFSIVSISSKYDWNLLFNLSFCRYACIKCSLALLLNLSRESYIIDFNSRYHFDTLLVTSSSLPKSRVSSTHNFSFSDLEQFLM
jgi:hypothetical protein